MLLMSDEEPFMHLMRVSVIVRPDGLLDCGLWVMLIAITPSACHD